MDERTKLPRNWIIAHRGASGEAPENTLAAFRLAVLQGCDAVELDVRLSRDGHVVVCHDSAVERTTNGKGAVHRLTLMELQRLDAGSWFSPEYAGESLPTLEQVFRILPPDVWVNIEVKHSYGGKIEQPLVQLIRQFGRVDRTIVSSFRYPSLSRLQRLEPELRIGLLYSSLWRRQQARMWVKSTDVYSLHPKRTLLGAKSILQAIRTGMPVFPYTINREPDMHAALDQGAAGIITDYPGRLQRVLQQRIESSTAP